MSAFEQLFGNTLTDKSGASTQVSSLAGNYVGIYFSAHWCPPCRGFTPALAKLYNQVKADNKNFEIVFVSSDKDEEAFNEYLSEMPWKALPYADRDRKAALSKKFKVSGIPSLIIIDADGKTINSSARGAVAQDPSGRNFPWVAPTVKTTIKEGIPIFAKDGAKFDLLADIVNGKDYTAFYFSASWCGPCHRFTPQLVEIYPKIQDRCQIVFVSNDKTEDAMKKYYESMPWLRFDFQHPCGEELSEIFGVEGIPSLCIIDNKTMSIVSTEAVGSVMSDPEAKEFPWRPKALNELSRMTVGVVNEGPTLHLVFPKSASADQVSAVLAELQPIAAKMSPLVQTENSQSSDEMYFLYSHTKEEELESKLFEISSFAAGNKQSKGGMYIFSGQHGKAFHCQLGEKTTLDLKAQDFQTFLADFSADKLEGTPLSRG